MRFTLLLCLLLAGCSIIDVPCEIQFLYKDIVYPEAKPTPTPRKAGK